MMGPEIEFGYMIFLMKLLKFKKKKQERKKECERIYGGTYNIFKIQEKDREV